MRLFLFGAGSFATAGAAVGGAIAAGPALAGAAIGTISKISAGAGAVIGAVGAFGGSLAQRFGPFIRNGAANFLTKARNFFELVRQFSFRLSNSCSNHPDFRNANTYTHIFDKISHNLVKFVEYFGGSRDEAMRAVINAILEMQKSGTLRVGNNGVFSEQVSIGGFNIWVKGVIVNGIPRIGTFYQK